MPPTFAKGSYGPSQRNALFTAPGRAEATQATGLRLAPGRSYAPGGALGRFFVERRLSLTQEAAVYAINSYRSGPLAVKIFDLALVPRAAVSRAYALQRRCKSPLTIAALTLVVRGRYAYLVMERARGPSLEGYLCARQQASQSVSLRFVLQQFARMAAAAAVCHHRGVVHGDIKPSNFVLSQGAPHRLKLADFNLAHDGQQGAIPGAGTTAYMAPELLRGAPSLPASDVWALGIALFYMVVGIEPHYADDEAVIAAQVIAGAPAFTADDLALFVAAQHPPQAVLTGMLALFAAATARDPAARLTASALAEWAHRLALLLPEPPTG